MLATAGGKANMQRRWHMLATAGGKELRIMEGGYLGAGVNVSNVLSGSHNGCRTITQRINLQC